jgi:sialic acid synthase SpsE
MGADIIEKHFTLDKSMAGPDHKASLDPKELCGMVRAIRNVEKALGDAEKKPTATELKNRPRPERAWSQRETSRRGSSSAKKISRRNGRAPAFPQWNGLWF